ncbi:hypothetical protein EC968_005943, partial [Mortierella alpina]
LLKPVVTGFNKAFINPNDADTAHRSGGSVPTYLSGWITALCFFDSDGVSFNNRASLYIRAWDQDDNSLLTLGGTIFHRVDTKDISAAYADVPVVLYDNGTVFKTVMIAGLVGTRVSGKNDKIQPQPAWWIAEGRIAEGVPKELEA